jgi:DNA-binding NarL/FixJ family response regulator
VKAVDQPWVLIVLFGLVVIVYARFIPKSKESSAPPSPMMNEIEETMEHFASELEEQNQALIQMFAETKKEYALHTAKLTNRIEALEKLNQQQQQELVKLAYTVDQLPKQQISASELLQLTNTASPTGVDAPVVQVPVEETPEPEKPAGMNIKERYVSLFELYDQGKSIEVIAKKLGMNKGEVNLIVQLAKQEEKVNA